MNRAERRAAFKVAEEHPEQQRCRCGWLMPRECYVALEDSDRPPARITIIVVCPVCDARAEVLIERSPEA